MDSDEVSFWSKISKLNLKTFASLAKTNQIKCADEKIITISADRNLFGRLLIAAKCRDVDGKEVLRHELSTVPFALAHADGALRKTTKSVLMNGNVKHKEDFLKVHYQPHSFLMQWLLSRR